MDAWKNIALPIGHHQTISQPYVVAAMTEALTLTGEESVLEIGTGSGYQAAILSRLAKTVISVERISELARSARLVLDELGCKNVEIIVADGSMGWEDDAPYQAIIVTAAAPVIPDTLLFQLDQAGGTLVAPVGTSGEQRLVAVTRNGESFTELDLGGVAFVPLIGQQGWENNRSPNEHANSQKTERNESMASHPTIGHVHLKVADLERSVAFYEQSLGFELQQRFGTQAAFLSVDGYHHHIGLNTWESRGGSLPPFGSTGLYHFALLYPGRIALANAYRRLLDTSITIDGAADHGVSEAVYLHDPDLNGIEIYWDRPRSKWPRSDDGTLAMISEPLDLDALLQDAG